VSDVDDRLAEAMARVPILSNADTPQRLGGLTNVNFRIGEHVVRLPGAGTTEYINRTTEEVAARSAAAAGVNAPVEYFDASDGLMITRFIDGATTMSAAAFTDLGAVGRAARVLRTLHTTAAPFASEFGLFTMIDEYKTLLATKGATLPDGYEAVQQQAEGVRAALEAAPVPMVPCHCDPLCENFLDTGERMMLIDYEYAGNNDPMWDLGDMSVEGGFSPEQDAALLNAYFDGDPPPGQVGRMVAYKAMCDLLWTLWGVLQHVNGNSAHDFWAYAVERFERCRKLMASAEFEQSIAAIVTPP
jgi:thiamine kinase-like enzyme